MRNSKFKIFTSSRVKLLRFFIILIFLIVVGYAIFSGKRRGVDSIIRKIENGYSGVVLDSLNRKGPAYRILTKEGEYILVGGVCESFYRFVNVGDSIFKVKNSNTVLVKRNNNNFLLPYIFIPSYVRESEKWPNGWDNYIECQVEVKKQPEW